MSIEICVVPIYRYSGKTQKQIIEFVRENYVKRQTFQRYGQNKCNFILSVYFLHNLQNITDEFIDFSIYGCVSSLLSTNNYNDFHIYFTRIYDFMHKYYHENFEFLVFDLLFSLYPVDGKKGETDEKRRGLSF